MHIIYSIIVSGVNCLDSRLPCYIAINDYYNASDGKKEILQSKYNSLKSFLRYIRGRINFVGQVAKANKELNKNHYKTRMNIHNNLLKKFNKLAKKEGINL